MSSSKTFHGEKYTYVIMEVAFGYFRGYKRLMALELFFSFSNTTTDDPSYSRFAAIGSHSFPSRIFVVVNMCELLNPINNPGTLHRKMM